MFAINKPGTYYISLFTDSPVYQTNLRVRNIRIRKLRTSTDLPVEVSNLKAVGAEKGELKVVADFDMPTKYISGNDIPATTDIDVKATIGENSVTATGHPGEHITLTVPSLQGTNQLSIQTSIDGLNGKETVLDVFTGVDVPGPVGSLTGTVSADNLTIFAKWTPPTEGENGYYIDPDDVVYNLMQYGDEGWQVVEVLGKKVYEYTYSVPEGSPLATARFGIAPSTVEGRSGTILYLSDMLGTPFKLPVHETFEDAEIHYRPFRIIRLNEEYVDSEWGTVNPRLIDPTMECESGVACYGRSEGPSKRGMVMLPKFDLEGVANPGIVFNFWTGESAAEVTILAEKYDSPEFVEIGRIPTYTSGWQQLSFPLPESFFNHKWAAIYIDAYFENAGRYALFTDYEVRGDVTGIGDVNVDNGWIRARRGAIVAEGFDGREISVYSLDGRVIWSAKATSDTVVIPAAPGTYVVKAGTTTVKIIVR